MPCPEKFIESLDRFSINPNVTERILDGFRDLVSSSPKKRKAAFFARAMTLLDANLDWEGRCELMEYNACCKGGQRAAAIKHFVAENTGLDLAGKIAALAEVPRVCRHKILSH